MASIAARRPVTEQKIVSISSKRQITIPQKFFSALGFSDEAQFILRGDELILRPVRTNSGGEFAEQILAELIAQGLTGDELLNAFKARQAQVRPAVEALLTEAEAAAKGEASSSSYADIFGAED